MMHWTVICMYCIDIRLESLITHCAFLSGLFVHRLHSEWKTVYCAWFISSVPKRETGRLNEGLKNVPEYWLAMKETGIKAYSVGFRLFLKATINNDCLSFNHRQCVLHMMDSQKRGLRKQIMYDSWLLASCFTPFPWFSSWPRRWRWYLPRNFGLNLIDYSVIIYQNMELFISIGVRTSHLIFFCVSM
jgi:hypothetical protein